jgi:hypothetical protein
MQKFLFVVDIPPSDDHTFPQSHESHGWRSFEAQCGNVLTPAAKKKQISRNVWMLDVENSFPILRELSNLAAKHEVSYSAFLISGEVTDLSVKAAGSARVSELKI